MSQRSCVAFVAVLSLAASQISASEVRTTAGEVAPTSHDAEAQYQLARSLLSGSGGEKDPVKAFELMMKAAAQGHADALGGVGYFYARGLAVPEDDTVAIAWFRQGAEKGSAKAQLNLGLALAKGRGAPVDEKEGLRWIDQAAASGFPEAVYSKGETYLWGQFGRALDYSKALALLQHASARGLAIAQTNLGVMLRDGLGTPKDEAAAINWFRKAATQGDAKAQSNLGHLLGVEAQDRGQRLEALTWVIRAAEKGEVTAQKTLEELVRNLSPDDYAEAWARAREATR